MRGVGFLLALALLPLSVRGQTIAQDGFTNGPLVDLHGSTGGTGWVSAWSDGGTDVTTVTTSGLVYPGLATAGGAAVTPLAGGVYAATLYNRSFPAPPAGSTSLYVSFLLRLDAGVGMWGGLRFGQYPYAMTVGSPLGAYQFGMMTSQGLASYTNQPLVLGQTTLVVVKVTVGAAGGSAYRMYLDPVIGSPEPANADASFVLAPVAALPTALAIDNGTGFTTDEIRVGLTWGAVLPAGPTAWTDLGFAKPGSGGAPRLVGNGSFAPGSANTLSLTQAQPLADTWLVTGFLAPHNVPFLGGVLVPEPVLVSTSMTDASGTLLLPLTVPGFLPAGLPVIFQ